MIGCNNMHYSGHLGRYSHKSSGVIFILGLCTVSVFIQVLLEDEPVSTRQVLLAVLDPSKVEHSTKYVITKQGGNFTLDCTDFDGEDVNWTRLGDKSVVQSGKQLSLIRVDRSDSGIYVCSVSGGSNTISLLVEHVPTITPTKPTISQSPGYPSSLSCQVTAVPVPAVSWYRLGSPHGPTMIKSQGDLSMVIDEYKDGRMTSRLIFYNVTQEDYGQYSCNATNRMGQASATVQLVFSPTPVLTDSSKESFLTGNLLWIVVAAFIVLYSN